MVLDASEAAPPRHYPRAVTTGRPGRTRYVLVHGAGGSAWEWHLVAPLLERLGHDVRCVELPCDDEAAGLDASAEVTAAAVDAPGADEVVVVAQSFAGVTAPLACARADTEPALLVLLCAMVPAPGERAADWWEASGMASEQAAMARAEGRELPGDDEQLIVDDIPPHLRDEAARHRRRQVATPVFEPWPLDAWPGVPTAVVLGLRDRFFPPAMQRRIARERLGLEPHELDAGHVPALSAPGELVTLLEHLRTAGGQRVRPQPRAPRC